MIDDLIHRQTESWRTEQPLSIEDLVARFTPEDITHKESLSASVHSNYLLELICNEVALREECGESPTLQEYQDRFPYVSDTLKIQWDIDRLLDVAEPASITLPMENIAIGKHIEAPKRIGRYEIRNEVGRGAIGIVYEAWDTELKRTVAIKRLRSGIDAEQEDLDRMWSEAEAIAQVRHPNIVQIHDVGQEDELPYLAMEYCEGGSFAKRLIGKPLEPRFAARFVKLVASGVAAAHKSRIVHRDLKPANILLVDSIDWIPKVSDFGLAKLLDSDTSATATGSILGTPSYMAPEQAFGDAKRVGPSADVYSIGAILYECLTGRPPFRGTTIADTLDQVRNRDAVSIRSLEPQVPTDLETIVHKCLRKDPSRRYCDAQELVDDLDRFLERKPILARRERWVQMAVRIGRKYPLAASLSVATLFLLLAITIGSTLFAGYLQKALNRAEKSEAAAKLGQADALVGRAHGIRLSRRPGQRFEALKAIEQAVTIGKQLKQPDEWFVPIRDEAIAAMMLPDIYVPEYFQETEDVLCADINADHSMLAVGFKSGRVSVRNASDQKEIASIQSNEELGYLLFCGPADILLLGKHKSTKSRWRVKNGKANCLWTTRSEVPSTPLPNLRYELSRDQLYLAVYNTNQIEWLTTNNGDTVAEWRADPFQKDYGLALHPSNNYGLLHSYHVSKLLLKNLLTGETVWEMTPEMSGHEQKGFSGADWRPDGTGFVTLSGHGEVLHSYRFEINTRVVELERTVFPKTKIDGGTSIRFNRLGDRLHSRGWAHSDGINEVDSGRPIFTNRNFSSLADIGKPRFDSIGTRGNFVSIAGRLDKWGLPLIAEARECQPIEIVGRNSGSATLDPSSRIMLVATMSGFNVVGLQSGQQLLSTPFQGMGMHHFAFDRTGNFICSSEWGGLRFPYQWSQDQKGFEIGFPERIFIPPSDTRLSCSHDGKTIGAAMFNGYRPIYYAGCRIKLPSEPAVFPIRTNIRGNEGAVSPDGSLVAFSLEELPEGETSGTFVFSSTPALEMVHHIASSSFPIFSDDGTYLRSNSRADNLRDWTSSTKLHEGATLSMTSDGCIGANAFDSMICLVDLSSGRTLAHLESLEPQSMPMIAPDGSRVVSSSNDGFLIYDLPAIRSQLELLGLNWSGPEYVHSIAPRLERVTLCKELQDVKSAAKLFDSMNDKAIERGTQHLNDGFAQFAAAMAEIERWHLTDAKRYLDRSCELLPNALTPRLWRAYVAAALFQYESAIEDADWVLSKFPEINLIQQRAEWHYQVGNYRNSIQDCDHFLKRVPVAAMPYYLRSLCHQALGEIDLAAQDRASFDEKASTGHATLVTYASNMAGWDISLHRPIHALGAIERLRSLKPDFDREQVNAIGLILYRNGRYQEALEAVLGNFAPADDEYQIHAYCLAAMATHHLERFDEATSFLKQAMAIDVSNLSPAAAQVTHLMKAEAIACIKVARH